MEKTNYFSPEVDVIVVGAAAVICTSGRTTERFTNKDNLDWFD